MRETTTNLDMAGTMANGARWAVRRGLELLDAGEYDAAAAAFRAAMNSATSASGYIGIARLSGEQPRKGVPA